MKAKPIFLYAGASHSLARMTLASAENHTFKKAFFTYFFRHLRSLSWTRFTIPNRTENCTSQRRTGETFKSGEEQMMLGCTDAAPFFQM